MGFSQKSSPQIFRKCTSVWNWWYKSKKKRVTRLKPRIQGAASYAGSRIIFRATLPKLFSPKSCHKRDIKFCSMWKSTDIVLCLWSGFIYSLPPLIRAFDRKTFSRSLFKKEDSWRLWIWNLFDVTWDQLFGQSKNFPTRLLGLLKNETKSADMSVLENSLVKKASGRWCDINPATGVGQLRHHPRVQSPWI